MRKHSGLGCLSGVQGTSIWISAEAAPLGNLRPIVTRRLRKPALQMESSLAPGLTALSYGAF